jgi:SAM-dependent methyltransferase
VESGLRGASLPAEVLLVLIILALHRGAILLSCLRDGLRHIPSGVLAIAHPVPGIEQPVSWVFALAALREFHRILKPGGRISLAEPVFMDEALAASAIRTVIESKPPEGVSPFMTLLHRWKAAQYPDTEEKILSSPIANYSERDLIQFAKLAGFPEVHLELHIDTFPSPVRSWDVFINSSPHPLAPPLAAIMAEHFTAEERQLFERSMRPIVEDPKGISTDRMLYLNASKPLG